ncbi:MAG: hypothetical protein ABL977_00985 [Candidatus Eisenbacteria bacterium]
MKNVRFSASGGRLFASVKVSAKREGSYELRLWERETNALAAPSPMLGHFLNNDTDEWPLPRPNAENDGRLLQCVIVLSLPPDVRSATVSLVISQDGEEIAREARDIPEGVEDHQLSLWVQLRKGA